MTGLDIMWVGIGGGIGAVIRWSLGAAISARYSGAFPVSTFFMNVSGTFIIAYLSVIFGVAWQDRYGSLMVALVLTGVLGGYTTFSSMQLDALKLTETGRPFLAIFYLVISVGTGLLAAYAGFLLAHL